MRFQIRNDSFRDFRKLIDKSTESKQSEQNRKEWLFTVVKNGDR